MQQQKRERGSSRENTETPRAEKEVAREGELDGAGGVIENQFTIFLVDGDQNPLVRELLIREKDCEKGGEMKDVEERT